VLVRAAPNYPWLACVRAHLVCVGGWVGGGGCQVVVEAHDVEGRVQRLVALLTGPGAFPCVSVVEDKALQALGLDNVYIYAHRRPPLPPTPLGLNRVL
jgi:hypothetical protein